MELMLLPLIILSLLIGPRADDFDSNEDYIVQKYTSKMDNIRIDYFVSQRLVYVVEHHCNGLINREKFDTYWKKYFMVPDGADIENDKFLARNRFVFFTVQEIQHICRATNYMFGKDGVVVPNVLILRGDVPHTRPDNVYRPVKIPDL